MGRGWKVQKFSASSWMDRRILPLPGILPDGRHLLHRTLAPVREHHHVGGQRRGSSNKKQEKISSFLASRREHCWIQRKWDKDQGGWVLAHVPTVRKSRLIRRQRRSVCLDTVDLDQQRRCQATRRLVGREFKWKALEMANSFAATLPKTSLQYVCHSYKRAGWARRGRTDNSRAGRIACTFPFQDSVYGSQPKTASRDTLESCCEICTEPETYPTLGMSSST